MVALILGLTALIGVMSPFALSTTSLVREVHTAHQVDQLSKNVSIALLIQGKIDRGFEDRANALEEAVLYMEQEIQNIKVRLLVQCHSLFRWSVLLPCLIMSQSRMPIAYTLSAGVRTPCPALPWFALPCGLLLLWPKTFEIWAHQALH